ncbi:V-type ATP synthase subunit E [Thiolapillus sp.]|uniref:V-type ATP synthase subunit E n=1 Tax=Thiolapillus sp. TaxID=2017437 RepID=UPI00263A45CE|nr:V-type ATP synthase subunit E family protein [Thiolapillus sp.]
MTRTAGAQIGCQRPSRFWGLGCPKIYHEAEDTLERLQKVRDDRESYLALLHKLLVQAAEDIESTALVAEFNASDLAYLKPRWETFSADIAPGKTIELAATPIHCSGGVLLRSRDNRIRIDNSFEGRIERFQGALLQVITERLFAADISLRGLFDD